MGRSSWKTYPIFYIQREEGAANMEQYDLLEYFLKWFIPFACAGLFAVCVKPLIDAIKRGKRSARDEEFKRAFEHEIAPV